MLVLRGEFVIVISERLQYKTHVFIFVGVLQQCCNVYCCGIIIIVYCYGIIIIEYMSHNVCLLSYTHTYAYSFS